MSRILIIELGVIMSRILSVG